MTSENAHRTKGLLSIVGDTCVHTRRHVVGLLAGSSVLVHANNAHLPIPTCNFLRQTSSEQTHELLSVKEPDEAVALTGAKASVQPPPVAVAPGGSQR